ncbi:MAG: radical SAM protein [Bacteroidales bacterium]|jgi:uncharacterized protein|nr:radical SAM protein [Bacteroidales bacterium]
MRLSKHTIISRIADSEEYFIINPLVQQADILNKEEAEKILRGDYSNPALQDKKYVLSETEEQQIFTQKYLDFMDNRDSDEIQIFFAPWYACNFACSYCYQHEYTNANEQLKPEIIDAFFSYIENAFAGRRKYITIFGGEPLMKGKEHKKIIETIVHKARETQIDIALVTNGYHLNDYADILAQAHIREVQVTLDGTEEMHNSRRIIHGGGGSFTEIVSGIDTLLRRNVPINLRVVVDKENISNLPELAEFSRKKGWTDSPLFKTQLGRNYELHSCQTNNQKLFSRIQMYREIYSIIQKHPGFLDFHKPGFSISKFLWEQGELPDPLFDSCPGTKTEWAFDYLGNIYSCTATVGKTEEKLGTFYPEVHLDANLVEEWEERDVMNIDACKNCSVQLACGGGCASVAKNNNGSVLSPDCRPITELLELGIANYFTK